jgi:hypothetical protein
MTINMKGYTWLTEQEKTPAPYVLEMKNASQFWVDRVQKQFKDG